MALPQNEAVLQPVHCSEGCGWKVFTGMVGMMHEGLPSLASSAPFTRLSSSTQCVVHTAPHHAPHHTPHHAPHCFTLLHSAPHSTFHIVLRIAPLSRTADQPCLHCTQQFCTLPYHTPTCNAHDTVQFLSPLHTAVAQHYSTLHHLAPHCTE